MTKASHFLFAFALVFSALNSSQAGILDACRIRLGGIRNTDYVWQGEKVLSDIELRLRKQKAPLPEVGAKIGIIGVDGRFNSPKTQPGPLGSLMFESNGYRMRIVRNTPYEDSLLSQSGIGTNPHEVLAVHAKVGNDFVGTRKPLVGDAFHVDGAETVAAVQAVLKNVVDRGLQVSYLEITHTHPVHEIAYINPSETGNVYYMMAPLSPADLSISKIISKSLGTLWYKISAITPNGYTYELYYRNGEVVPIEQVPQEMLPPGNI
jgi:hypothetical protein